MTRAETSRESGGVSQGEKKRLTKESQMVLRTQPINKTLLHKILTFPELTVLIRLAEEGGIGWHENIIPNTNLSPPPNLLIPIYLTMKKIRQPSMTLSNFYCSSFFFFFFFFLRLVSFSIHVDYMFSSYVLIRLFNGISTFVGYLMSKPFS